MIDLVIPLGWGSQWFNQELKYSLRSFDMFVSGIRNLVIVTDLSGFPDFLNDSVLHIPCPDATNLAAVNTYKKIHKACMDKRVSDDFLLSNDDFFINRPFKAEEYPYYYRGEIMSNWEAIRNKTSHYSVSRKITSAILKKRGYLTRHFGIHVPFLINKEKFLALDKLFPWEKSQGLLTRSIYGNYYGLTATQKADVKLQFKAPVWRLTQIISTFDVYSIGDQACSPDLWKYFEQRFPKKSRFER